MKNKEILVTGGAGYVGSILLRKLLSNGYKVTCVDNLLFGDDSIVNILDNSNFSFFKCDISDCKSLNEILISREYFSVIHLAAIVGDPACKLNQDLATKTNWDSSVWLLDRAKELGIPRFIFASTCSNYGKMSNSQSYLDENSSLAPVSLYADLKVRFEHHMLNVKKRPGNFAPTSLRFSTVYGLSPRMRFDLTVNEFTKELAKGRELMVFGEQFWRPYCHVEDFSNAFLTLLTSPVDKVAFNVFNVGDTSENYTKKMIVDEIIKLIPDARINYVKKDEDPRDYRVNFSKIKHELGFQITKRVPDGISEIIKALGIGTFKDTEDQKYYNIPIKN
jgi:nucleoside-diphosphate-sugar epimerase